MEILIPFRLLVVALLSGALFLPAASRGQPENTTGGPAPAVDPAALKALQKMGAYLRTLATFEVESTTSIDEVLDAGQKVQFNGTVHLQARRPNGLHAEVASDRKHREFFYDGKTFTLFGRRVNFYATVPAPPTLRELITVLAERYGIEVPMVDLFLWGSDDTRTSDIRSAIALGPSTIGGAVCQHYALREEGADWQIWIQEGATPFPRKMVITTTSVPAQPQYVTVMNWTVASKFDDSTFSFSPPEGAVRIVLQNADGKVADQ